MVAPSGAGGPAGASRSSSPRSTATRADQATIGLVTEARGKISSTSPASWSTPISVTGEPVTVPVTTSAVGKGKSASAGRTEASV